MVFILNLKGSTITEKRICARCFSTKFDKFPADYFVTTSFASTAKSDIKDTTVRTTTTCWLLLSLQE